MAGLNARAPTPPEPLITPKTLIDKSGVCNSYQSSWDDSGRSRVGKECGQHAVVMKMDRWEAREKGYI